MKLYNPFKLHIVKFSNGKYGLRHLNVFHFGWMYKDLANDYYSWSKESIHFKDCMTNTLDEINLYMITDEVIL
jgi:hypothetical protein